MTDPLLVLAWFTLASGLAAVAMRIAQSMDMLEPGGRGSGAIECFQPRGQPSVRE